MDMIDEDICRFCFEGRNHGPLISPCVCTGYQKYVHLSCIRSWQRMALINLPTHPAFYNDDNLLFDNKCNVCLTEYTSPRPSRFELMQTFTGSELAAMVDEGFIIASHEEFSKQLDKELEKMPQKKREQAYINHWIRGVFLITSVKQASQYEEIQIEEKYMLFSLLDALKKDNFLKQSDGFRITGYKKNGVTTNFANEFNQNQNIYEKLHEIQIPFTLILSQVKEVDCGEDHICAVNLTRKIGKAPNELLFEQSIQKVLQKYPGASKVEVSHYIGGPNDTKSIIGCLVPGGYGRGWTIVQGVNEALALAYSRSAKKVEKQGNLTGGQAVELIGLKNRQDLNGQKGLTLQFQEKSERWDVLLNNGEGKCVKSENLKSLDETNGRVYVFWGYAGWSRTQLLGELAQGSWGMCKGYIYDIISPIEVRRKGLDNRLVYSPETSMTEKYIKDAQKEMNQLRQQAQTLNQNNQISQQENIENEQIKQLQE